ncbi:hypothetical protein WOLCODRAFT_134764 [Wolfiporia cocos MD-104 SS10]|uniref:Nicotinamide N-methyltransferase n=1 Tax=Wolfiporia cocos (strain MD-104) TaxID=742152 RepID=A0A2H3JC22_WOLCO|nr:hypothetical protein WOLCODRAFT_134764 [Wolfiporia cocos MD-104 SS10]
MSAAAAHNREADDLDLDTAALFGDTLDTDDSNGEVYYGPLVVAPAPKEGKANTLLADHLFSPSLLLSERIERGLVPLAGRTVIELGAGCALPSLLASTRVPPPALVVATDHPDRTILPNLERNVARNRAHAAAGCTLLARGYEWGADVRPLLELLPAGAHGYDAVVLSDLLHFDRAHGVLLASLTALLARTPRARVYVAAGKYTAHTVCAHFIAEGERAGLVWSEGADFSDDCAEGAQGARETEGAKDAWKGTLPVRGAGLDAEQLGVRKGMCRWWVGRWAALAGPWDSPGALTEASVSY